MPPEMAGVSLTAVVVPWVPGLGRWQIVGLFSAPHANSACRLSSPHGIPSLRPFLRNDRTDDDGTLPTLLCLFVRLSSQTSSGSMTCRQRRHVSSVARVPVYLGAPRQSPDVGGWSPGE